MPLIPLPPNMSASVTFKEGQPLSDVRGHVGTVYRFSICPEQGFNVLKEQIASQVPECFRWNTGHVYLKKTNTTAQRDYIRLQADNMLGVLEEFFNLPRHKRDPEACVVTLFVYVEKTGATQQSAGQIRRATQSRMNHASTIIREFERNNNIHPAGNLAHAVHVLDHARRNEGPVEIPNTALYRQATLLDNIPDYANDEWVEVPMKFGKEGAIVPAFFNIKMLRQAFNIPAGNVFQETLRQNHGEVNENILDLDHIDTEETN